MIARSGNIQRAPIAPVKVPGGRARSRVRTEPFSTGVVADVVAGVVADVVADVAPRASRDAFKGTGIMEGSDTVRRRDIVTYGHP
jgi:hypothetical protein